MLSIGAPASCPMQSPSPCGSLRVFSRQPRRLSSRSAPPPLSTTFKTTSRAATKTCTFRVSRRSLDNPSPTYYFAPVIKHGGLTWRHRALRRIESGHRLACGSRLKRGPRGFVAVPNLYLHTHGPRQLRNADPVEQSRAQCASGQLFIGTNRDPMTRWIDLQHVKRGRRAHAETLPLPHGKAGNPLVPPDNLAARRNQFACRLRHLHALLLEIRGQKLLVIPAGDEANLLRVGLLGQHQAALPRNFTNLSLGEPPQRKERVRQLFLRQTKQKISLILGEVRWALENPAAPLGVKLVDRVVSRSNAARANAPRRLQKLVELEMVVAQRARNRRPPGKVLIHKRPHHIALEPLLLVHNVVGNPKVLGTSSRVLDIVQRAAPAGLRRIGNSVLPRQPRLIPELQRKPHNRLARVGEHRRRRRGVNPSGHSYRNCCLFTHGECNQLSTSRPELSALSFQFVRPQYYSRSPTDKLKADS